VQANRLRPRRARVLAIVAITAAVIAFPLGVLANHIFADVPTGHTFHADIEAIYNAGVTTTGCGGGNYCPDDFVTRGQMAAFLNRLGALGPGKVPVANADKLDGFDSADFAQPGPITEAVWGPLYGSQNTAPDYITAENGLAIIGKNAPGNAVAFLPLSVPLQNGHVEYGWSSAEVCFNGIANVTLTQWSVFQNQGDGSYQPVALDVTAHDLASDGCFSLDASGLEGGIFNASHTMGIRLDFTFAAGSIAALTEVTVVWAPTPA
jgi:hypothetical protein